MTIRVLAFCCICAAILWLGCAVYPPVLLTEPMPRGVTRADVVAAAVQVVTGKGYAISLANEKTGIVTTEWADAQSSLAAALGLALSGDAGGKRKQATVTISADGTAINIQFTKQQKGSATQWANVKPGDKERKEAAEIRDGIKALIGKNEGR